MLVSKHRDHFCFGCPAYSTGINLFPGCGVGCLFSDGSSVIGMLAGFWNGFRLRITAHQTGKFLLSFCFAGSCVYYPAFSIGMLLIAALFRIISNITGSISGHTFMPMGSRVIRPAFRPLMFVFLPVVICIMENDLVSIFQILLFYAKIRMDTI